MNFLGDALVRKGAKKASTGQNAKIMLFDPTCHAKASPMLCIYENDIEANVYYYSETQPTDTQHQYWHYASDNKTPVVWEVN